MCISLIRLEFKDLFFGIKTICISCSVNMSFAHFSTGLPAIFLFVGALYVEINPLPFTNIFSPTVICLLNLLTVVFTR